MDCSNKLYLLDLFISEEAVRSVMYHAEISMESRLFEISA